MTAVSDLTDKTFGRLKVLGMDRFKPGGRAQWVCECIHEDGSSAIKVIDSGQLTSGRAKSCGCIKAEKLADVMRLSGPFRGGKYKGVFSDRKYFKASLGGRYLGNFQTPEEAARAYDAAAYAEYGADCYLNFPEDYGLPAREAA